MQTTTGGALAGEGANDKRECKGQEEVQMTGKGVNDKRGCKNSWERCKWQDEVKMTRVGANGWRR